RPLLGARHGATASAETSSAAPPLPLVEATLTPEVQHPYAISLRGRTQAARTVSVRAETSGVVAETPILQGTSVRAATVLCRLAVDARQAAVDEADANLRAKQLQMQASSRLVAKGYISQSQLLTDRANLDSASATVRQAEVALNQVNMRAPFAGVFDHRDAEVGAYLSPGQPCGTMIELDPLLIVGDLPETEAGKVQVGAIATARLVSGEVIQGKVRFVARDADPATRTYRVEVTAANPRNKVGSGLSADIQIGGGSGPAHLIPVSALVLDAAGRQGVRYVSLDNRVAFAPVTILEQAPQGVWVAGLSGATRLITVGQSYVSEGQRVRVSLRQSALG
ncbi:MAG TPA: efflux RND transporter periplasmic adaptor subunit, partial [Caulobacteraceae bacterium]|nr:efflux RND transporter periplasmic adaptor subunit [Caulobacteraceae bacterium]